MRVNRDGEDHVLTGLPRDLMRMLVLAAAPGAGPMADCQDGPCCCRVKSVVVPAFGLQHWRDCHRDTPLGEDAVKEAARYLGIQATSPASSQGR